MLFSKFIGLNENFDLVRGFRFWNHNTDAEADSNEKLLVFLSSWTKSFNSMISKVNQQCVLPTKLKLDILASKL